MTRLKMISSGILEIIAVYGTAIIILLVLTAAVIYWITRNKRRNKTPQYAISESLKGNTKSSVNRKYVSSAPKRKLTSSEIDIDMVKKDTVIGKLEKLSPLKRGIIWAEILGRPGGRRRRNT